MVRSRLATMVSLLAAIGMLGTVLLPGAGLANTSSSKSTYQKSHKASVSKTYRHYGAGHKMQAKKTQRAAVRHPATYARGPHTYIRYKGKTYSCRPVAKKARAAYGRGYRTYRYTTRTRTIYGRGPILRGPGQEYVIHYGRVYPITR